MLTKFIVTEPVPPVTHPATVPLKTGSTARLNMFRNRLLDKPLWSSARAVGAVIFITTLLIFWFSPVRGSSDTNYSMLVSQSLLEHRSFALDGYDIPRSEIWIEDGKLRGGPIYQLEIARDHVYYFFPPGSSVLSVPFVAVMNAMGISAANPNGTYSYEGELKILGRLAAILMAGLAVVFFYIARLVLPLNWSALIAFGGALGTQVWSTASRVVWTDTWAIFLLGFVVWMLLAHETGRRRMRPVLLACLLSWTYFARPTNALSIIAITIYLLIFHRHFFIRYALTGALWLAAFLAYSWSHYGQLLPTYYRNRLQFEHLWTALAGNLVSPSRGLLVYVPALFFVAYLLVRYRKNLAFPRLVVLSLVIIVAHLIAVSGFVPWYGGGCYGPRYTTGLVPWFVLLAVSGVKAMLTWRDVRSAEFSPLRWRAQLVAGAALLTLSVFINARGAVSVETWRWNVLPVSVDKDHSRVWDWRYPQFLAGLINPPLPGEMPRVATETRIDFTSQSANSFLWYGWSGAEPTHRWSEEPEAALIFAAEPGNDIKLQMKVGAYLANGKLPQQELILWLNGERIETLALKEGAALVYTVVLPGKLLERKNILVFELPDAKSPTSLNVGSDERTLGVRVEWMVLQPKASGSNDAAERSTSRLCCLPTQPRFISTVDPSRKRSRWS